MPDFNPLKAEIPVIRPEIVSPGLSLIVKSPYDYINTFPESNGFDTNGNEGALSTTINDSESIARRRRMLGLTSISPAATTDYNTAKRYNKSDLGYTPGIDNEDLYARNEGFFKGVGKGLSRLVGTAITKTGTGIGFLAGLSGIGNDSSKYGDGFGAWIAGAGDNGFAKWFQGIEDEKIKQDWLPIYKKATEKDHGFFRHAADLSFWTDDLSDGLAFVASALVPGMAVSKLKLGTTAMRSLAALRGLTYADEAAALASTGVSGMVESENLVRAGLGATIESPAIAGTIKETQQALQELPRAIKWIDNAKAARAIDVGTMSIVNSASESMYEANDAKNNTINSLMAQKDANGQNKYTIEQARLIGAKVAKDSYLMNLGALSLSGLWEANFFFKKAGIANRIVNKIESTGLLSDATLAKRAFGERAIDFIKEPLKGIVAEGLWEENIQLAIQRLNENPDNFDLNFGEKLLSLGKQYVNQTKNALVGDDLEASKSIGMGALLGGVMGKFFGHNDLKDAKKSLANLNSQVTAFKNMGNIYKTKADGSLDLVDGSPVVDEDKIKSWTASFNNVLSLQQVANNFGSKGVKELAAIYQDEVFARFAKAHFDNGLGDLLQQKLSDISNIKEEDLALLGYDPYSKDATTPEKIQKFSENAKALQSLYDNIHQNFVPTGIKMNTEIGKKKYFDITDKLFYLSARSSSISNRISDSQTRYDAIKATADTFNESYNSETDTAVTSYNELFEKLQAAKKHAEYLQIRQDYRNELNKKVNERRGSVAITNAPSRLERLKKANPSTFISLPNDVKDKELDNQDVEKRQADLDQFVTENKEVLNRLKKDSKGRYLFEMANKNHLPSAKEMERMQIIQAELGMANNATLNVMSRLADPRYGVKYWDEVYSDQLERHAEENKLFEDQTDDDLSKVAQEIYAREMNLPIPKPKRGFEKLNKDEAYAQWTNLGKETTPEDRTIFDDQLNDSINRLKAAQDAGKLTDDVIDDEYQRTKALRVFGKKEDVRKAIKEELNADEDRDLNDINDQLNEVSRERDYLDSKDDRTPEEEERLEKLNRETENLKEQSESAFEALTTKEKIESNPNVKPEDKATYQEVMKKITAAKKGVIKYDDHYEVNGEQYRKVTDLIGDSITPEQRANTSTQAAVNAGNSVDAIVKAYFAGTHNDINFKFEMSEKISQEAYDNIIKSLDKIKAQLDNKGIQIVASNVIVTDANLKVAGEIDLLGIDKDGNFKIFEIQARQNEVYRRYGKQGVGIKIRDIDGKRLSMYRNMFANQFGVIPDEISVKFPFEVKYDKTNPVGFIDGVKLRDAIRFKPLKNVQIKMNQQEPLRIGSKYEGIDMTKMFLDTFLTDKLAQDKLQFLFRNLKFDQIKKGIKLTVKPAQAKFLERFVEQRAIMAGKAGQTVINKFRDYRNKDENGQPREFDNLYSLYGNIEVSISYEGQVIGYFSPLETLAYKDVSGNYQILDENTNPQIYAEVTGNSINSYNEFRKVAAAYKKLHTALTTQMLQSGGNELSLTGEDLAGLVDFNMSYGELDLLKKNQKRPDLKNLQISGVKVGTKSVPTIVNLNENDAVQVIMEKGKVGKNMISKYQEIDRWANQHIDEIKAAMTDRDGMRVTNDVAIIETPNGEYKIISVKAKEGVDIMTNVSGFAVDLGSKFTTSVSEKIFKNQGIMVVPKIGEETVDFGLKEQTIISKVYPTENIDGTEKFAVDFKSSSQSSIDNTVEGFLNNISDKDKATLQEFDLTTKDSIIEDYANGDWSSIEEYLENIKNCK